MSRPARTAVYPGTFDPVTLGHLDVLRRASRLFDHVIVAVAPSDSKGPWFSVEERLGMAREACKGIRNVKVLELKGLTVEFAHRHKAAAFVPRCVLPHLRKRLAEKA